MKNSSLTSLLVIEDSHSDFLMLKRLMRKMNVQHPIHRCETGDEALELIYQAGQHHEPGNIIQPGIIMLDLNLPGTDGREVLRQLKQDGELSKIPVVVFTTSAEPNDIDFCYRQGANGYLVKPVELQELTRKLQAFVDYWLEANTTSFFVIR